MFIILYIITLSILFFYFSKNESSIQSELKMYKTRLHCIENILKNEKAQQETEKKALRKRIASDLHDEIGGNLNSIGLLSYIIEKQTPLNEENTKRIQTIQKISEESALAMKEIVWFINPENNRLVDLAYKMKQDLHERLNHLEIQFMFDPNQLNIELSIDSRRHIYMIFKECLQNIIKHSEATKVDVVLSYQQGTLFLSIKDNGVGFPIKAYPNGNGILNLKKRATELDASLRVTSEAKKGAEIILEMFQKSA